MGEAVRASTGRSAARSDLPWPQAMSESDDDQELTVKTAERLLGASISNVSATSSPNAFQVEADGQRVIAKIAPTDRPGAVLVESWAYSKCAEAGVRAPAVLAVSSEPELAIFSRLSGESLWSRNDTTPEQFGRGIFEAGRDLRKLHSVKVRGFGEIVPVGDGVAGAAGRWCPYLDIAIGTAIPYLAENQLLHVRLVEKLTNQLRAVQALVATNDDCGVLLHGDLEGGHIFLHRDGTYEGMIDFGQAHSGYPLWDLARVGLWDGQPAFEAALNGYGPDLFSDEEIHTIAPAYRVALGLVHAMRHQQRTHGQAVSRLVDATRYWEVAST